LKKDYLNIVSKENLQASENNRKDLIAKLGCFPVSIITKDMLPIHNVMLDDYVDDSIGKGSYYNKETGNLFERGKGQSQFPLPLAKFVIKFWSEEGDSIFDPFNERLPRVLVANFLKRNVAGQDISIKTWEHNYKNLKNKVTQAAMLMPDDNKIIQDFEDALFVKYAGHLVHIQKSDSRKLFAFDDTVDLVFTSPPYYDCEFYGDEPEQAGCDGKSYEDFLDVMLVVMKECYRILKKDKYIVWNVADFRKDGRFYLYGNDSINLLLKAGFTPHDVVIFEYGGFQKIFTDDKIKFKRTGKVHEYCIVMKK